MSRIGLKPIPVPNAVQVDIADGNLVTVKGPKGQLQRQLAVEMILERDGATLLVKRPSDARQHKALHGLTRTLLSNMVVGVTDGFKKELEINGVGYRAAVNCIAGGKVLLGYLDPDLRARLLRSRKLVARTPRSITRVADLEAELARVRERGYGTNDQENFEGIVAIKELDDPPAAGTEVWHEFMTADPARPVTADEGGGPLPPVYPEEMAFPRAHDD